MIFFIKLLHFEHKQKFNIFLIFVILTSKFNNLTLMLGYNKNYITSFKYCKKNFNF